MKKEPIFDEESKCFKPVIVLKSVSFRKAYQYHYYRLNLTILDPEFNFLKEHIAEHFIPVIKLIIVCSMNAAVCEQ
jgi:hypothetical protein